MAPLPPDAPVGIYLHVPFCSHICPYCDFNTYRGMEALIPRYVTALCRDLEHSARQVDGRVVGSIFLGGGTPSLLDGSQVEQVMETIQSAFSLLPDAEVTLEANPNTADRHRFEAYRAVGVNRLSIGVQTTDRRGLRVLGRRHEATDATAAFEAARDAGFEHVSADLIFGWPGQDAETWRRDLATAASWPVDHLSLYSLIVEPGTPMADAVQRGVLLPLDDDDTATLYEIAQDEMCRSGFGQYEVANWARGETARSRHNQVYWRNGEFLGLGAGAHGTVGGIRTMRHLLPRTYVEAVETGASPVSNTEWIDEPTARAETMMLGLRLLDEGVTRAGFLARHGESLDATFGPTIAELMSLGLLVDDGERIILTPRGLMLANDVCARFL